MAEQSQAALLKYLAGEITFGDWLDAQELNEDATKDAITNSVNNLKVGYVKNNDAPDASGLLSKETGGSSLNTTSSAAGVAGSAQTPEEDDRNLYPTADEALESGDDTEENDDDDDDYDGIDEIADSTQEDSDASLVFDLPKNIHMLLATDVDALQPEQRDAKLMAPIISGISKIIKDCRIRPQLKRKQLTRIDPNEKEDIVSEFQDYQLKKRRRRGFGGAYYGPNTRLPELLRLHMGQANLHVAKGEFKEAADICMEIIKEAPNSALPFKTLSFIYEEQGNGEMALQYSLIAAFLQCRDASEWLDLSARCREAGLRKQELTCYDRACRLRPHDRHLQWTRATMYFENGDFNRAMDYYQSIFKMLQPTDASKYMEICKNMTEMYLELSATEKATDTLGVAFDVCPDAISVDTVDMYTDLLLSGNKYEKIIDILCRFCRVKVPPLEMTVKTMQPPPSTIPPENMSLQQSQELEEQSASALQTLLTSAMHGDYEFPDALTKSLIPEATSVASSVTPVPTDPQSEIEEPTKNYTNLDQTVAEKMAESQYEIPDDLQLELRVKLVQSLIHMKQTSGVESCEEFSHWRRLEAMYIVDTCLSTVYEDTVLSGLILAPMFAEEIDEVGAHYLSVGEAYLDTGKYVEALKCFQDVIVSPKYNQASVWLKIAECYDALDEVDRCIEAYNMVLMFAPHQVSVRLSLAAALRGQGKGEEALRVLKEYDEKKMTDDSRQQTVQDGFDGGDVISNRLKPEEYEMWHQKCLSLHSDGHIEEFICNGYILLHNYLLASYALQKKQTVSKSVMWDLFILFLRVSTEHGEYKKAAVLLEAAFLYRPYAENKQYRLEMDYMLTTTYMVGKDYSKAFDAFRVLLLHESEENKSGNAIWNLFTMIVSKMLDKRHHRFTLRLLFKKPQLVPLIIQNGINSHLSGTYKYAIGEFSRAFREWPTYPLISLLLGVSFLHLSCQKFHTTRHTSILHGMIFIFQYFRLQKEGQEAYYNVARAFQQIGLVHFAVHYYNKALQFPLHNEKKDGENAEYDAYVDLHREAAYNLSMIYKASGNHDLARKTLYKYCWV